MTVVEAIFLGVGLAMDCLAVSFACCSIKRNPFQIHFRLPVLFALFQGGMFMAGWLIGDAMKDIIASVDHWVAFGLLVFIGCKMIIHTIREEEEKRYNLLKWSSLLALSFATSIDAGIAGIGVGFTELRLLQTAFIIAFTTFLISLAGVMAGRQAGNKFRILSGEKAEIFGGVVLIALGIKILFEHRVFE
ncbi:MAG: manganese efflux pump [Bacteroidetes bacterium]|nr:manganese efflux pump [Bacteroidota bacterium]